MEAATKWRTSRNSGGRAASEPRRNVSIKAKCIENYDLKSACIE